MCWTGFPFGALAQLGERLLCKQDVVGSIPSGSTICGFWFGLAWGLVPYGRVGRLERLWCCSSRVSHDKRLFRLIRMAFGLVWMRRVVGYREEGMHPMSIGVFRFGLVPEGFFVPGFGSDRDVWSMWGFSHGRRLDRGRSSDVFEVKNGLLKEGSVFSRIGRRCGVVWSGGGLSGVFVREGGLFWGILCALCRGSWGHRQWKRSSVLRVSGGCLGAERR